MPNRGQLYMVDDGEFRKPYLIVSNNARNNSQLDTYLAVRITTSSKPSFDSIVEMGAGDPLTGRALCDDISVVLDNELVEHLGAVAPNTMMRIDAGLRAALALR